ncbi:MAG: saccharopine dehydrogenase NADP-binding domain-containing protein [bacterium]
MGEKITILGAVGSQTISTSIDISRTSRFDEIVLADGNMEKARELASSLKDERIRIYRLDATRVDSIADAIRGCEIIINGLPGVFPGSPVSIESNVVEAAVRTGVKFIVDINCILEIDGEFGRESFARWDRKLKEAGIGVPLFSGGITTCELLAVKASRELDRVDEVHVYWGCAAPLEHAAAGLVDTVLWEENPNVGDRLYYANGKIVRGVEPFGMRTHWEYPEPVATRCGKEAYILTHTEPLTLSEVFPEARIITSRGVLGDREADGLLKFIVKHGIHNMEPMEVGGVKVSPLEFMRRLWIRISRTELEKIWKGQKVPDWYGEYSLEAEVIGVRNGIGARSVYSSLAPSHPFHELLKRDPIGEFGVAIGVPMSVTACMLLDGEIEMKTGLLGNVGIFPDVDKYFAELTRRGFRLVKTAG